MGRRDDVIDAATAILREQGPDALTSVNVAARLGVTQSAIYRHIDDIDELTRIASHTVVNELSVLMIAAAAAPETTWGTGNHIANFAARVVALIEQHPQSFAIVNRWRYDDGPLGEGIRANLSVGQQLIASELEDVWHDDFDCHEPFDEATTAAQLAHAGLMVDDVISVARFVDGSGRAHQRCLARLLGLRLFAGWCGYVLDINRRMGIAIPELGSATMAPPVRALL